MIGLSFLAAGLLWLALSWYLATRLPKWLSIKRPLPRWSLSAMLLLLSVLGTDSSNMTTGQHEAATGIEDWSI